MALAPYLRFCLNSSMSDSQAALRALANPGRRRALQALTHEERTSGSLAALCGWSKPAASQHLKVLREAGLVEVRADGNRRLYQARADGLAQLRDFLDAFWTDRLSVLEGEIRAPK
jgi:DNA-binding transcriptional ArsR family regulator